MNLCPFHTEVIVNMCRPVCMRRSVCTKSNSTARVRCPWLLFTKPNFHPRSQDLLSVVDPENHRSLVSTCIPTGWLNTTVQFSWIEVTLARDKMPQITLPQFKGRHPSLPPRFSLLTSSNANDKHGASPWSWSGHGWGIRACLWPRQLQAGASTF